MASMAKHAARGSASNASARDVGDMVDPLASIALDIAAWVDGQIIVEWWRVVWA